MRIAEEPQEPFSSFSDFSVDHSTKYGEGGKSERGVILLSLNLLTPEHEPLRKPLIQAVEAGWSGLRSPGNARV
jgi:hypothetical protein